MPTKLMLAPACLLVLCLTQAQAHFIWVDLKPGSQSEAQVYFGESPEPSEPHLLAKVAQTKAWIRGADGETEELKLAAAADPETAALVAGCPRPVAASLEAACDYGLYARCAAPVLLQYYAKHLAGEWTKHAAKLTRSARLLLDIAPAVADGQLTLQVLYQGRPAADSEVVVVDPMGEQHTLKTDAAGTVRTPATAAGRYAAWAAVIEPDRAGQRDGKPYKQTWHYCTLTLDLPKAAPAGGEISAGELLKKARAGRSAWNSFPGFTADLAISSAGIEIAAKATIDANGAVSVEMPQSPLADWVDEQLNSLVQHRMPDGEIGEGQVTYADGDLAHPLGRKIDLGDASLQSAYRIKDDVILEVNRTMGELRFMISVLEIVRNVEHKYLPRSFVMNFFDNASGELKTSLGYWNEWQRVGDFDLPKTIEEVEARKGSAGVRKIVFKNVRLMEK